MYFKEWSYCVTVLPAAVLPDAGGADGSLPAADVWGGGRSITHYEHNTDDTHTPWSANLTSLFRLLEWWMTILPRVWSWPKERLEIAPWVSGTMSRIRWETCEVGGEQTKGHLGLLIMDFVSLNDLFQLDCCGVHNWTDWGVNVPESCCRLGVCRTTEPLYRKEVDLQLLLTSFP